MRAVKGEVVPPDDLGVAAEVWRGAVDVVEAVVVAKRYLQTILMPIWRSTTQKLCKRTDYNGYRNLHRLWSWQLAVTFVLYELLPVKSRSIYPSLLRRLWRRNCNDRLVVGFCYEVCAASVLA